MSDEHQFRRYNRGLRAKKQRSSRRANGSAIGMPSTYLSTAIGGVIDLRIDELRYSRKSFCSDVYSRIDACGFINTSEDSIYKDILKLVAGEYNIPKVKKKKKSTIKLARLSVIISCLEFPEEDECALVEKIRKAMPEFPFPPKDEWVLEERVE